MAFSEAGDGTATRNQQPTAAAASFQTKTSSKRSLPEAVVEVVVVNQQLEDRKHSTALAHVQKFSPRAFRPSLLLQ